MREFADVKKRDVIRAFGTIRLAMEEKCDKLTDWSLRGNALEQAVCLRVEDNVTRGLDYVERFLLGPRAESHEEGRDP
jgi:hypothetical protein